MDPLLRRADAEAKLENILGGVLRSRWRFVAALDEVYFTTLSTGAIGSKGADAEGKAGAPLLQRVDVVDFRGVVQKGVDYYESESGSAAKYLNAFHAFGDSGYSMRIQSRRNNIIIHKSVGDESFTRHPGRLAMTATVA